MANGLEAYKEFHHGTLPASMDELESWLRGDDHNEKPNFDTFTKEAVEKLTESLGRRPTPDEISEYIGEREN